MQPFVRVLLLLLVASLSAPAWAANAPKPLVDAAKAAANDEKYCRSRDLFMEAFTRDPRAKYLYNAAEGALAADDRSSAAALYGQLLRDRKSVV